MFQGDKQRVVAGLIKKHRQLQVEPEDCIITNGALGALMVSLQVLTDPGDEVIMITPWYFFYPAMCEVLGIKLVGVPSLPGIKTFLGQLEPKMLSIILMLYRFLRQNETGLGKSEQHSESHDLDLEAIERAISPRTRVILINSPNNPTGAIYPKETLQRLSQLLDRSNSDRDSPIFLISDEAYCREVLLTISF